MRLMKGALVVALVTILMPLSPAHAAKKVKIRGGGWGHGIGLCQVGAMGRARAGQSYRQILTTYYTGTEISRLY